MARIGSELVKSVAVNEGEKVTLEIRKKNLVAGYLVRFTATHVIAGGATNGTAHTDALHRMIQRVRVGMSGIQMQEVDGRTLRVVEKLFQPSTYEQTAPATLAATAGQAIELYFLVPFYMFHSYQPEEFALATYDPDVQNPTLEVQLGYAREMVYGEDRTHSLTNARLQFFELPQLGTPLASDVYAPLMMKQWTVNLPAVANGEKLELRGLLPLDEIRAVLIETEDNGAAGADYRYSNAILGDVALRVNGSDAVSRTPAAVMRQRNKSTYGLAASETGVVVLDAAEDKNTGRGELWTVRGELAPELEYDVAALGAGSNRMRVTAIYTTGRVNF